MPRRRRFGNIRRLPSGRWQVRYLDPRTGLQAKAPRTFETRGHAEAWLADRSREVDRDVWNPAAATKDAKPVVLFGDYAQRWLDTRTVAGHPLRPRTKRLYQGLLTNHLLPAFSNTPLAGITAADVRDWHAGLCLDAPTCRAHSYALLRAILNTAVADELIDANPCRVRGAGAVRKPRHQVRPATLDELQVIVEAMPERLQLAVVCASWLAMRLGEVLELRRKDIDLAAGCVHVSRALVRVGGHLQAGPPKTDAGQRSIAIPPHLLGMFEHHLACHTGPRGDALLFPSQASPARWHQSKRLYELYRQARAKAGRDDLRWHDLRHTGAVLAAQAGASLAELQARLGHTTVGAAMRYQSAAAGRDAEVARRMTLLAQQR